jgi:hypothetical protein
MISRCLFGEAACVRFGSLADIGQHVRFAPESGHVQRRNRCLLSANSRHPVWSHKKLSSTAHFCVLGLTLDPALKVPEEDSYVDLLVLAQLEVMQSEGGEARGFS